MGNAQNPTRLCSEIQLFDLCSLDVCEYQNGRYCTKEDILAKFEAIKEEDECSPEQYLTEELDGEDEDLGYDEANGDDEFDEDPDEQ